MSIRNSAKAIIIKDGKLLCTKNKDQFGIFYLLPGGGQNKGENIIEALKRECKEEIGAEVEVGDLKFVRDYIGKNHEFKEWDSDVHQIEYMFICFLKGEINYEKANEKDAYQIGIEWIDLKNLKGVRIYPKKLSEVIKEDGSFEDIVYLGDVN
ncbi:MULTISPECIES: NUDIX domain-containing protein [Caloramator]|jgi:8-oxo-dGTP diphosphatase|uniref:Mutator mutT protein (7,8-dihydro-8-oxoguanine-triphosphatase) n=1 Tax=Caloramator australicus RC3 TaxID=857293 RepID=I7K9L7_9CLOT|nr:MULTISPECIES: NUDIX domain-containing protein [Caloramator]MDO6355483.1 NUDIX domain-containing protein [Caloramator sp. CAR-1]CCJ34330.1 Mutator mutT protein (7,8-dihydro-8-oxoguanine-triphosphatase) [Caloramator australicus RC3]